MKNESYDKLDNILFNEFERNLKMPKDYEEKVKSMLDKTTGYNSKKRATEMLKHSFLRKVASVVVILGVAGGAVYAGCNFENIKKFIFDGGIGTAVENGYVANIEQNIQEKQMQVIENNEIIVDNIEVGPNVDSFVMDDSNLCINFSFNFENEVKKYLNLKDLHLFELENLVITDGESKILFENLNKEDFKAYCQKCNLQYEKGEFNENYINSGVNIVSYDKTDNTIKIMYNVYGSKYPKVKKIKIEFNGIRLAEHIMDNEIEDSIVLKGEWSIELSVPEQMYNRTSESYKVVKTSNENFEVYSAKVSDTGFEFGTIIKNCKDTMNDADYINKINDLHQALSNPNITEEENLRISKEIKKISNDKLKVILTEEIDENNRHVKSTYVTNSNGKRFELDLTVGRKQTANRIDDDTFDYYNTFEMTKKDSTDKIEVILDYRGEKVNIELEKVK